MRSITFTLAFTALLAASLPLAAQTAPAAAQAVPADGSSPQRAVLIDENDTRRGIMAENAWLQQHLPGYRKRGQALIEADGRIFDRIDVVGPNGEQRSVYFDISRFFGRIDGKLLLE